jgi:flagellar hook protein FlgE
MSLTNAMLTGLTGLNGNQIMIDTIGNNLANLNTTAYKGSRANFENQFSLVLSNGTGPSSTSGGTNPSQIGLGTLLGSIQRNFQSGPIQTTGVPTDMAIDGMGFFVVNSPSDGQVYTRDGTFKLDANNDLVTSQGFMVQGYGVDDNFKVLPGALTNLNVPLGALTTARATSKASLDGNLNAAGTVATQGSLLYSQAFTDGTGAAATDATLLADLRDPANPVSPLFAIGNTITLANVSKGGAQLPQATYQVTAASTLGDFATFLQNQMGINTDPAIGGTPGVRVSTTNPPGAGALVIESDPGEANALSLDLSSIRSDNPTAPTPFGFTTQQAANGESVTTSFIAYDSLGTPVQVDVTMALVDKSTSGNTWRFYTESRDSTGDSPVLGTTGTVTFDPDGRLVDVTNNVIQVGRADTGAVTPLQITLDFSNLSGLTSANSTLLTTSQDGFAGGTLTDFAVGNDGVVTGIFSNGLTRALGQLALANFTNPEGLIEGVNNTWKVGPNSGLPTITAPQTAGAGRVLSGSLEMANVDMTREFIGLITASTGFSASGRVITAANDLLNELLTIAR